MDGAHERDAAARAILGGRPRLPGERANFGRRLREPRLAQEDGVGHRAVEAAHHARRIGASTSPSAMMVIVSMRPCW